MIPQVTSTVYEEIKAIQKEQSSINYAAEIQKMENLKKSLENNQKNLDEISEKSDLTLESLLEMHENYKQKKISQQQASENNSSENPLSKALPPLGVAPLDKTIEEAQGIDNKLKNINKNIQKIIDWGVVKQIATGIITVSGVLFLAYKFLPIKEILTHILTKETTITAAQKAAAVLKTMPLPTPSMNSTIMEAAENTLVTQAKVSLVNGLTNMLPKSHDILLPSQD